jgi:hypothetical protein
MKYPKPENPRCFTEQKKKKNDGHSLLPSGQLKKKKKDSHSLLGN